jgi:sugar lactone lactonase YvrE
VLKFDFDTGSFIGIFSDEQTRSPDGISFGPNGNLFVSSVGSNEILEYGDSPIRFYISDWTSSTDPEIISFNSIGSQVGTAANVNHLGLSNPGNIVTDSKGRLWIADTGNERLVQLNVVANEELKIIPTDNIVEIEAPDLTQTSNSTWIDDEGTVYDEFITDVTTSVTPKGLSMDSNDNFYVSDWDDHRIVVLNPTGNFLGQIRVNSTFTEPMDITINQTSSNKLDDIWVYDKNFEEIQGHLLSLDVEKQFESLEFIKEVSPLLRGLTTNGTSLVTTPFDSGSLLEIDASKTANFDSRHFIVPLGIDLDNSEIYVSDWKEQRIVKLDESGNFEKEFDLKNVGFVTDEQGDIEVNTLEEFFWVTEPKRATIDQIWFNGSAKSFPSVGDQYVFMSSVDADKEDNFYVVSNQNSTISKYDIRGTKLADAIDNGFNLTSSQIMVDISLGPVPDQSSDSVFLVLAEKLKDKIVKFNSTDLTEQNSTLIDLIPTSVAVDNNGFVYISNSSLIVTKLDSDLSNPSTFEIPSFSGGMISDMVIDSKNNLYAADTELNRIYKYNLTDSTLEGWLGKCTESTNPDGFIQCDEDSMHSNGFVCDDNTCSNDADNKSFGRDVSQFFEPTSLTVDGLNNVYVGDIKLSRDVAEQDDPMFDRDDVFNRGTVPRVQKFTQNGFFVEQVISNTNQTLVKGNFDWIQSIAYGTNNFYVANTEKLHVFDVNPFFNVTTNLITNQTSAELTYLSIIYRFRINRNRRGFIQV